MPATRTQQAIAGALLELPTKSPMPLGQSSQSRPKLSPTEPSLVDHLKGIDKPAADLAPLRLEILFFVAILTMEPEIVLVAAYLQRDHLHLVVNEKERPHVLTISVSIVLVQGATIVNEPLIVATLLVEKIAETADLQEGGKGPGHLAEVS